MGVRALGDGTVGQRGGGVISVHDATRRAKMKADAGAAAVIQGPNSVQRTGAILSISPPEREAYLFAFDVRGVNEVGPTLDPLPRELMFVLLRAKLERRDRLRRDGEKSRFVNFKFDCFFKRIEFHDFTFKCIDKFEGTNIERCEELHKRHLSRNLKCKFQRFSSESKNVEVEYITRGAKREKKGEKGKERRSSLRSQRRKEGNGGEKLNFAVAPCTCTGNISRRCLAQMENFCGSILAIVPCNQILRPLNHARSMRHR